MSKAGEFMDREARRFLKEAIESSGMTYKELVRELDKLGYHCNDRQLTNRVNRGNFKVSFAFFVMRALKRDVIPVPKVPVSLRPPPKPLK